MNVLSQNVDLRYPEISLFYTISVPFLCGSHVEQKIIAMTNAVLALHKTPWAMHCSRPMSLDTEDVNLGLASALVNKLMINTYISIMYSSTPLCII